MTTKSSGFTLIELLVVVALIGIISAIGIVSYNGYVNSAKKKAVQNVMQQIALGQTEWYSGEGEYYTTKSGSTTCDPDSTSSNNIEENLLGGSDSISDDLGYNICTVIINTNNEKYRIIAKENTSSSPTKYCLNSKGFQDPTKC
ncbi:prepilin-type N-terminal cleavage/methylation domain-containing protein [Candidatus Pelagibacter sp.]|nr:prepilin-type N-terminal cleavage/methylation domain-containing protein [Candidatus Pelagibacter sp.]